MSGVVVVLFLGLLNLGLGYALAVYLGYGPANLWEAWESLSAEGPGPKTFSLPAPQDARADEPVRSSADELAVQSPEEPWEADMDAQLRAEAYEEDMPEMLVSEAPENWDLNEKFIETSVLKLNIAMMKSGARATQLDTRLRACRGQSDEATIRKCLTELEEDCRTFLAEQSEAAAKFHDRVGELGELAALGEEIEMANLEQSAQIETTLSNLRYMDFASDLEAANQRLLEEIKNLRLARHRLRDSQEAAFLTIAAYENRMDKIERRMFNDPLTRLRNRVGLEATLWQWWQEGRHKTRQMSAALFDLDNFGLVDDQHGLLVGDRILYQLARVLESTVAKADLLVRFAGQRFLVLMVDVGPRAAVRNAELVRQQIERVTFLHRDREIRLTASVGIVEITPQDSQAGMLARAQEMLKLAKEAGRNRAFFHNGKEPEAIESPNLGAKYKEIRI